MIEFFTAIWEWILNIPTMIMDSISYLVDQLKILFYELMTSIVEFTSNTFVDFTSSSNYLGGMETNYLSLSQDTRYAVEALNIPEAILLIISAYILRFTIKMIPFV